METTNNKWRRLCLVAVAAVLFTSAAGCGKRQTTAENQVTAENPSSEPAGASEGEKSEPVDPSIMERIRRERWTDDLNGMVQRRYIRALVTYNRTFYFYDGAEAKGASYEALKEFERFLNDKLKTGNQKIHVIFIPVSRGEMARGLIEGRGDIAASNIAISPAGLEILDFSDPVREGVSEIVVTGPSGPALTSLDDLTGKEVFVRKQSRYWFTLTHFNEARKQSGKPGVILKALDEDLEDEDILEMVNAGIIGITVVDSIIGELWAKIFDQIKLHPDLPVATNVRTGWAFRKNSPELAAVVNEFVKDHKAGTSFGNTVIKKYFQTSKWIADSTSSEEMKKFEAAADTIKKRAGEYGFDWLLVAAQAYQESRLNQSARSSVGAVGVMQIKPSTAAGNPVNIKNVEELDSNVLAGVKYMRFMMDQYFKDSKLDRINKGLFAFASYNAGPNKVARLRKQASDEGLDPDKWFNNVELIAGREIGAETVTYVSNIYKYFVAYKLVTERAGSRKRPSDGNP